MLEVFIDAKRTSNLKQAILDAIENGEYENLQDDIRDCFDDEQIEEIEAQLDFGDIEEAISETIEEWNGDSLDDLLEVIETYFSESTINIQFDNDGIDLRNEDDYDSKLDTFEGNDEDNDDDSFDVEEDDDDDDDDEKDEDDI